MGKLTAIDQPIIRELCEALMPFCTIGVGPKLPADREIFMQVSVEEIQKAQAAVAKAKRTGAV